VVSLAQNHRRGGGIFHISSPDHFNEGLFERLNAVTGASLKLMPMYDWICEMKRLHYTGRSLPIVPLIEFAFSMDERSFYEQDRVAQAGIVPFDCARTYEELERAGIIAPTFNDEILSRCVADMLSRDSELRMPIGADGTFREGVDAEHSDFSGSAAYPGAEKVRIEGRGRR
jgi:hypothetical protein